MEAVKISPKFQVVIPRDVREKLHLVAGQKMQVAAYGNRIELIPEKEISEMLASLSILSVIGQVSLYHPLLSTKV